MKVKKKALSLLLAVVMVLGIMPFNSVVANAEDTGTKKIELGTGGVADKDFVYFGNYNNENIKWKVLDADADNTGTANGMFLLSEYLLEQKNKPFDADRNPNEGQTSPKEWQHSDAQGWCTAFADNGAFTSAEKGALKSVSKSDAETHQYGSYWGTSSLASEKVFYLSAAEAATYIGANDRAEGLETTTSGEVAGGWWLRSPNTLITKLAGFVNENGYVKFTDVDSTDPGVRPAFNLNLNSVLFSSATEGGKSSGTVGAAALNSVSEYTSNTARAWKVTLLDANRSFTAQAAEGTTASVATGYSNWSVNVTYNNAATGSNEYVSAMLCDASGNVLCYGNIAQYSASGTQTVNIPTGLGAGNYTLKVFSEQLNGDNKTDYASDFSEIALEVTLSKANTPNAGFTATSENGGTLTGITTNMQYSVDGGTNWTAVTGTTMNIADVTAANGVQVYDKGDGVATSDSDAQTIAVTQASQPTELTKTDCTTAANNDGKISGVDSTMEYKVSGSADAWTAVTGTTITGLSNQSYDVRIKASGTVLASEAQSIAISAYVAPPAPSTYAVTVNNGAGDASCVAGVVVIITADAAPSGQEFDTWTVVSGGVTLASATSSTTFFEMPANAVEVTATYKNKTSGPNPPAPAPTDSNPPAPTPTYTITAGAGGTHELSTDGTLTITCDGALDKLTGIYVDDKLVDESNYTLKSGSTILTFNAAYINTLSAGTHNVKFQYSDGSVETAFAIKQVSTEDTTTQETTTPSEKDKVPKTGDSTPIAWLFIVAIISGAGVVYFGRKKKTVR